MKRKKKMAIYVNVEALEHPKGKLLQLGKSFINMRKIIRENFNCCKCHVMPPCVAFAFVLNTGRGFEKAKTPNTFIL